MPPISRSARRPPDPPDPLEARRRKASRIALYGTLAQVGAFLGLLVTVLGLVTRPPTVSDYAGYEDRPEVGLLQEYVRIDTSDATGNVRAGAHFLAEQLEEWGVPAHVEYLGERDANVWAIVEGEDSGAIVLHNHIDVEDIHFPERWTTDPFGAEIRALWLYGRGTYDMKSVTVAQLYAMRELARLRDAGVPLERSVIFLATTGEETGSDLGTRWILARHPELADRFELVLTEGGVLEGRGEGDLKYWGTEFAQKRYIDLVACSPSRERLEAFVEDLELLRGEEELGGPVQPLRLVPEVAGFLPHYAPTRDWQGYREMLADPRRLLADRATFEELPDYLKAMFRDELYASYIRESPGGGWEVPLKAHLLPGTDWREARRRLLPPWLVHGVTIQVRANRTARHGSPLDHPVLDAIAQVVHDSYPDVPAGPVFLPWTGTDARYFRAAGIPTYGFTPFVVFTSDAIQVGGSAERISLPGFVEGVGMYSRLVTRLAAGRDPLVE